MILYLCPFQAEARLLASILPACRVIGKGRRVFNNGEILTWNAAGPQALTAAIQQHDKLHEFSRVVLFGAGGALSPSLKIGELFAASSVSDGVRKLQLSVPAGFACCELLSVGQPILSAAERQSAFSKHSTAMVDMEGFWFAEKFSGSAQQAAIIRFVSDTAGEPFKLPFSEAIARNMRKNAELFAKL
ncbi:MAG TPA: hypothetical protein PLM07_09040 [Candidatus Rifleibacterium sp.]|nr:hypothetical protein [Candidatus Rifleibacterium sp.]